jgi:hypothetical protein
VHEIFAIKNVYLKAWTNTVTFFTLRTKTGTTAGREQGHGGTLPERRQPADPARRGNVPDVDGEDQPHPLSDGATVALFKIR